MSQTNQQIKPPSQNGQFLAKLLEDRYFQADEKSWSSVALRLARTAADAGNDTKERAALMKGRFYDLINNKKFCPASPIVMSLGVNEKPMLSSCFVLPIYDNMDSILGTLKDAGIVTCAGGGIGFDFSEIRPENSLIKSLNRNASLGPVGVLKMINSLVNELKQSGRRKGACMGSIDIRHKDMKKFVQSKKIDGKISNFNLSVLIDDEFMEKAIHDIDSEECSLLNFISEHACKTGDPGVMFKDSINRNSKFLEDHGITITAANTCGEIPMPPYGNCLLGSMNLSKYVYYMFGSSGAPDCPGQWVFNEYEFARDCLTAIDFLNKCLELNILPLPELQEFKDKYKQIGLGLTGFHDALIMLGIPYDSEECLDFIKILGKIMKTAKEYSWSKYGNITTLTLAPTGSVSILMGTGSFSVEPILFRKMDRLYIDNEGNKHTFKLRHPLLGAYDDKLFKTSMEISPEWHLKVVAEFQKFIDNAISKTIMLPAGSTLDQVKEIFCSAWRLGLKGITVYVDQSKSDQVYSSNSGGMAKTEPAPHGDAGNQGCDQPSPQKKKRPKALLGRTYKCRSISGSFYITLNELDGTAFEIFSTPNVDITRDPARSHEAVVNTEALTRIISLCLRSGIKPDDLAEQLERVKNQSVLSLPKQIADILTDYVEKISPSPIKKACPSCQKESLASVDGCWQCEECGWSKCS